MSFLKELKNSDSTIKFSNITKESVVKQSETAIGITLNGTNYQLSIRRMKESSCDDDVELIVRTHNGINWLIPADTTRDAENLFA